MKTKKKPKPRARQRTARRSPKIEKMGLVSRSPSPKKRLQNVFTPMETGQPDQNRVPGVGNSQAVQGGLGPLNQEGEGERQNDQLAELEQIEPDVNREDK